MSNPFRSMPFPSAGAHEYRVVDGQLICDPIEIKSAPSTAPDTTAPPAPVDAEPAPHTPTFPRRRRKE